MSLISYLFIFLMEPTSLLLDFSHFSASLAWTTHCLSKHSFPMPVSTTLGLGISVLPWTLQMLLYQRPLTSLSYPTVVFCLRCSVVMNKFYLKHGYAYEITWKLETFALKLTACVSRNLMPLSFSEYSLNGTPDGNLSDSIFAFSQSYRPCEQHVT